MESEENRIKTFINWPVSAAVKAEDLAAAGQYYSGSGDETLCYVCGEGLKDWEPGDDPYEEHKQKYPECRLSREPRIPPKKPRLMPQRTDLDKEHKTEAESSGTVAGASTFPSSVDPREMSDMSLFTNRLSTFAGWKHTGNLWSQNMALAGFHYTGPGDRVQCFACRVGLAEWESTEVPLTEHKKHAPRCPYLKLIAEELKDKPLPHLLPSKTDDPIYLTPKQPGEPEEEMHPLPESLEEHPRCIVCKDRLREILFEPCNHFVVCEICSKDLTSCPACGARILRKTLYTSRHPIR